MTSRPARTMKRLARPAAGAACLLALVSGAAPVIVCEPAAVDLGAVALSDRPTAAFGIRNAGDEPLAVQAVRTSCPGCVAFEFPEKPLPPGGSAQIRAVLTALPPVGPFRRLLYVHSNDPERPVMQLSVSASVRGGWTLSPTPVFALGEIAAGEARAWDYELAFPEKDACALTGIEAPAGLAVEAALGRAAARHRLRVTVGPGRLAAGALAGEVAVRTDSAAMPVVRVPLSLAVRGAVAAVPSRLVLLLPAAADPPPGVAVRPPRPQRAVLKSASGEPVRVTRLEPPAGVEARALDGPAAVVEVAAAPGTAPGRLGDLVVHFADERHAPLRLAVSAVQAPPAEAVRQAAPEAAGPMAFEVLLERLARHLDCPAEALLSGDAQDVRTQLVVWLAEKLCAQGEAARDRRRAALGAISLIRYARAREAAALRLAGDPQFRADCEGALAAVRGGSAVEPIR